MFLYHGSNIPVKTPKLIEQTRGLDFGGVSILLQMNRRQRVFPRLSQNAERAALPQSAFMNSTWKLRKSHCQSANLKALAASGLAL